MGLFVVPNYSLGSSTCGLYVPLVEESPLFFKLNGEVQPYPGHVGELLAGDQRRAGLGDAGPALFLSGSIASAALLSAHEL